MSQKKLLKHLVILMFFIFILNLLGEKFYWPYSIWYFDMPMHFLGGFWVVLFFFYFYSFTFPLKTKMFPTVLIILGSLLVWGIGWEFVEYYIYTIVGGEKFVFLDTASDVCFDLAGGLAAVLYYLPFTSRVGDDRV
jgi:hypothetical protein